MHFSSQNLFTAIKEKSSYLCVGLDPDLEKIPQHLLKEKDPVFLFCKEIIEYTADYCVSYKPNLAFFEALGPNGLETFRKVIEIIPDTHFSIADAKRGDIGNSSNMYAKAFFDKLGVDSITLSPYMGKESLDPFTSRQGKAAIVLALTSNSGSEDFQQKLLGDQKLYELVLSTLSEAYNSDQLMFVIGATKAELFESIRKLVPEHFFLVPGVGSQGGDLATLSKAGFNSHCGLLVNVSRKVIYAGSEKDFGIKSKKAAKVYQEEMVDLLDKASL